MAANWRDFLGEISGYKMLYEATLNELHTARNRIYELNILLAAAQDTIRRLELICPRPASPVLGDIIHKESAWVQQQLETMNLDIVRLPLDASYYLTGQRSFLNVVAWDWTDTLPYIKDRFDCENFALLFKAHVDLVFNLNQVAVIIDYQSGHGYNLVLYPDGRKQVLEPQSDALYVWTQRPEAFYSLKGAIALI